MVTMILMFIIEVLLCVITVLIANIVNLKEEIAFLKIGNKKTKNLP